MPKRKPGWTLGVIPDVHYPDHNPKAVAWAKKTLEDLGIHELVFLGDLHNVEAVSRFMKGLKDKAGLPRELEVARRFNKEWDEWRSGVPVTYLFGNHEARLSQYLKRQAPELSDLPELVTRRLLGVPDDWEVVPYGDFIKRQGVLLQHGRKWSNNTSRANVHTLGCSSVQGHSHRVQMVSHRFAGTNKRVVACEMGCLCNFNPCYAKLTDWCHACGYIKDGDINLVTRGAKV